MRSTFQRRISPDALDGCSEIVAQAPQPTEKTFRDVNRLRIAFASPGRVEKLDEERAKLLESAKSDALARAKEAINELTALGFDYELVEPAKETARKTRTVRKGMVPDHHPKGTCPICEYATKPPHDKRSHRSQTKKKPFTDAELAEKGMKMVA